MAPEGRKVGSLKRRVRSQLARWEMKNCTPLRHEAHFQVKMYKTHQLRTTFTSWEATLSTKSGGLGLRSIFRHSGAAYTASVLATSPICSLLLPTYNPSMDAIVANLNEPLLAADHVALPPPHSLRQQDLSRAVDRPACLGLLWARPWSF